MSQIIVFWSNREIKMPRSVVFRPNSKTKMPRNSKVDQRNDEKLTFFTPPPPPQNFPLMRTRTCVYQGVTNVSFSENFAYVLSE